MSEPTISPAVEARFKALAGSVDEATWSKLINGTADRMLSRLAMVGAVTEPDPELLQKARSAIGEALVDFANVALTCVAQGEVEQGGAQ